MEAREEAPDVRVWWDEGLVERSARWRSARGAPPPGKIVVADSSVPVAVAVRNASQGVAMLWHGPFVEARRLLSRMRKRWDRKPVTSSGDVAMDFYRHRQARKNRARVLGMVLVELDADRLAELGADDGLAAAIRDAYGDLDEPVVVSVRDLLGVLSAYQWQREGVWVEALGERIHPRYGVFSPTRDEYVDLVAAAPLPEGATVFDIGTGTGVLAALLAKRGARVVATDIAPRAVECAADNMTRLGLDDRVEVVEADLFPPGRADVVLCNPPWLPGTPNSTLDAAVFDHGGRMLSGFLDGVAAHLNPGGEAWLVISDLAERLYIREPGELERMVDAAGLRVLDRTHVPPRHPASRDATDPLADARGAERVWLWRLAAGD
ncbi:methyltransferase [Stackebrandtia nassauensis]|uniref:Methyltransferase small n=1 Tax=Stackebrandtia nassauensis (strain DSM 44728 / CIP 108903 / NRRL B-16338 / NBRC 102104 / LLR-40K-21) TaxID=446470 RepID=D3PYC1_STANL|nr:methyltransferase [Stackebrandtia nassauensis]ADD41488.1 methyltransferase small [Stackebrandtia nassauensis DSM 44728]